jgi:2-dehydro-3-deoxygluconokinase
MPDPIRPATTRVVCFGELLLRLAAPEGRLLQHTAKLDLCVGGAEANVAVSLACLGHAAAMVSVVPDNVLGSAAVDALRMHGVDVSNIARAPGRMGLYFLTPGAVLRPSEIVYDRAGSSFADTDPDTYDWQALLRDADWLHVSGISPAVGDGPARAVRANSACGWRSTATTAPRCGRRAAMTAPRPCAR